MNILTRMLVLSCLLLSLSACMTVSKDEDKGPVDYILLKNEAEQAYRAGDYKKAEEKYLKITKGVARDPEAWFRLGNIYARTQRPNNATNAYQEAILRNAKLSKAWNNLAIVYLRQSLNAYTSLVRHAEKDDPLIEKAKARLEKIYNIVGTESGVNTIDDPTKPPGQ